MYEPFLSADRALRKQVLLWSLVAAVLGLAIIRYVALYLDDLTALQLTDPHLTAEKYAQLVLLLAASNALVSCGLGGVLIYFSSRVLRSRQFPPPGMKVLWDTHLRTGSEAKFIAVTALAIASILIVAGLWLSLKMAWFVRGGRDFHHTPGPLQVVTLQTSRGSAIINRELETSLAEEQA
jgi:hypothetical protein